MATASESRPCASTSEIPEALLGLAERVRKNKGIGAALLRARCGGACGIELDRALKAFVRRGAGPGTDSEHVRLRPGRQPCGARPPLEDPGQL